MSIDIQIGKLMAEILRLQRWAGGEIVPSDRIFGLMHGFESVLNEENTYGISRETQDKVEDMLEDVESGRQSTDGPAIKGRLWKEKVSETDAKMVMQLCILESRFDDAIKKIISGRGSVFVSLRSKRSSEMDWFGALHYVELVDCTDGANKKMHGAFSSCVPRIGEDVEPEQGSLMRVKSVIHVAVKKTQDSHERQVLLIPHVMLEAVDNKK
jgi:hypothetical protein